MRSLRGAPRSRLFILAGIAVALAGFLGWFATGPLRLASADDRPLSQGKPATASSLEGQGYQAKAAVDGDPKTRWSSAFSDPQWIQVDLGASVAVGKVVLNWERAYATAFELQVSVDGSSWRTLYTTTSGNGGVQTLPVSGFGRYVRMFGTKRSSGYGFSLWEFQVYGSGTGSGTGTAPASGTPTQPTQQPPSPTGTSGAAGWIKAPNPVTNVKASHEVPPNKGGFHEFQANCSVSRTNLADDPIVFPGLPGASHLHTFMGNTTTNANTTIESLSKGQTTCKAKGDLSAYWMPTLLNGDTAVNPEGLQVIYYKAGVTDYRSVRAFPKGLRFVVGNAKNTDADKFLAATEEGFECGNSYKNKNIPQTCSAARDVNLNIRYQAPSCWDGLHLDSPDHQSHIVYPVDTHTASGWVCPDSHPVAVPKLEFKMAWPVNGDMSKVRFTSGAGPTFHYDFMNAWDERTLAAMVDGCIVAARQCDPDEEHQVTEGTGRRHRQWLGVSVVAAGMAAATVLVPPLIAPDKDTAAGPSPTPTPPVVRGSASVPGSSAPASFTPIVVEAEDPGNRLTGGAGVTACATCHGGARVRYLCFTCALEVRAVLPVAGSRTVTVGYEVDGRRSVKVKINGGAPRTFQVTGPAWNVPRSFQFTAELPAGELRLTFYNDDTPAPDLDVVTIT
ncbi:DUF1996 domain-containing protein [Dactylosporangium sp. NPDC005555]|uniref:DUF1996 domain-containing protein n=1 Tax=Dactylosporangium sp. NPDC005555 TaxID=3154889 RepID=UPI0033BA911F